MKKIRTILSIFSITTLVLLGLNLTVNGQVQDPGCTKSTAGTYTEVLIPGQSIFACILTPSDCIVITTVPCPNQQD
ncbi:MAG: hypothetical protein ACI9K1_002612 [Arcticibacterium sp.]|jgi:hypothetical protein